MARKKAREEVAQSQQPRVETSNRGKSKEVESTSPLTDCENSPCNNQAVDTVIGEAVPKAEVAEEAQPKKEEHKPLHVLAADRLNQLIDEANELGVTDIVQILNSDKYSQFYMVYRA